MALHFACQCINPFYTFGMWALNSLQYVIRYYDSIFDNNYLGENIGYTESECKQTHV